MHVDVVCGFVLRFHKENASKHIGLLIKDGWLYLIKAGEKEKKKKAWFQREMKQFCLYLLCYLARTAQINYSHLPHSIHYSSCKHISQMKCL